MPAFDPITAVANTVNLVLNRVLPDKAANDASKVELAKMQVSGELAEVAGQLEINKVEAASNSVFVAGWRPFVGWTLGAGLCYGLVLQPFIVLALIVFHSQFDQTKLPVLDAKTILELLGALLGFGAYRTIDKATGTGNGH